MPNPRRLLITEATHQRLAAVSASDGYAFPPGVDRTISAENIAKLELLRRPGESDDALLNRVLDGYTARRVRPLSRKDPGQ